MSTYNNKKEHACPGCKRWGAHYGHHVFGGALKKKSEKYGAIEYYCDKCHIWNKDSIHNNAELRMQLKRKHQLRIMQDHGWTETEWFRQFYENWL